MPSVTHFIRGSIEKRIEFFSIKSSFIVYYEIILYSFFLSSKFVNNIGKSFISGDTRNVSRRLKIFHTSNVLIEFIMHFYAYWKYVINFILVES